jgi:hypothetical protein
LSTHLMVCHECTSGAPCLYAGSSFTPPETEEGTPNAATKPDRSGDSPTVHPSVTAVPSAERGGLSVPSVSETPQTARDPPLANVLQQARSRGGSGSTATANPNRLEQAKASSNDNGPQNRLSTSTTVAQRLTTYTQVMPTAALWGCQNGLKDTCTNCESHDGHASMLPPDYASTLMRLNLLGLLCELVLTTATRPG